MEYECVIIIFLLSSLQIVLHKKALLAWILAERPYVA